MNLINSLKKIREKAVKKAEHRNKQFLKRNENWQRSASGVIYDSETQQLSDVIFKIDDAITEAKSLTNTTL
jgi:vacuolar-type H+-ATPase subunit H